MEPPALPTAPTAPDIGRYQVLSRLGAGAMGVVWLAVDPQLERKVAIKVVHPRLASSPEASRRMLREARAMAKLSHRGVVAVYDAGETDGRLFIAMELIDGETLTERLRRPDLASPKMWRERLALVLQAGRGLAAAHAAGVLHRDFKPDNVLVDHGGRVCVADFGLATLGQTREHGLTIDERASAPELTMTGALMGTPVYMSPEQLRGQVTDAFGDQFAFCVTAYEALYRVRPFVGEERGLDSIPALIDRIEAAQPAPGDDANVVPTAVREVLLRGMRPRGEDRWPDIEAVLVALDTASGLRARRRRRIALAAVAVAVVAAAASTGALLYARATPRRAEKKPLFRVPRAAAIAIDSDGRQIAVGFDHIELHRPGGDSPVTIPLQHTTDRLIGMGFDGDELGFSTVSHGERISWHLARGLSPAPDQPGDRVWVARVAGGELYADGYGTAATALFYVGGSGKALRHWPISYTELRTIAVSPSGRRFTYLDEHSDQLVVVALAGASFRSPAIANPTAVVWSDDDHLIFAKGTQISPTISELEVASDHVGRAKEIYRQPSGWIMRLAAGGGRLLFVDGSPVSRVRLTSSDPQGTLLTRDFDSARLAAELGWSPDGELLVWNRNTLHLARGPANGPYVEMSIEVAREPVNATFACDLVIVATRSEDGRDLDAYNMKTGAHVWKVADTLLAVRCADDRHAPCVALRRHEPNDQILEFDPIAGTIGGRIFEEPGISDVALRGDGHVFLASNTLQELVPGLATPTVLASSLSTVRSVAFGPDRTLVTAGTTHQNVYAVERSTPEGKFLPIMTSETELVLLVRSSPDGTSLAVVGRTFAAELSELVR
ncbi:hypothetical protein BH11MYX1_BH11MYX1_35190 [soil metagenome]